MKTRAILCHADKKKNVTGWASQGDLSYRLRAKAVTGEMGMSKRVQRSLAMTTIVVCSLMALAKFRENQTRIKTETPDAASNLTEQEERGSAERDKSLGPEDKPKEDITLSPTGDRLIYHWPFNPYNIPAESVTFTVADRRIDGRTTRMQIDWPARDVASVEWANDRYVLVHGEAAFLSILDTQLARQTHNLVGFDFTLAPDKTKLVYRFDFNGLYGAIPEQMQYEYVLITLLDNPTSASSPSTNYRIIYPAVLPWGEGLKDPLFDSTLRHLIKSGFLWSRDSQMVAFVEDNQAQCWLTTLNFEGTGRDISVKSQRFRLTASHAEQQDQHVRRGADEALYNLSWTNHSKRLVSVSNHKEQWRVDLETAVVSSP
jgi:hypothetical protein